MHLPRWSDSIFGIMIGLALLLSWLLGPMVAAAVSMLFLPFGAATLFALLMHPTRFDYAVLYGCITLILGISFLVALIQHWPF